MKHAIRAAQLFHDSLVTTQSALVERLEAVATHCTDTMARVETSTAALVEQVRAHEAQTKGELVALRSAALLLIEGIQHGSDGIERAVADLVRLRTVQKPDETEEAEIARVVQLAKPPAARNADGTPAEVA